MKFLKHYKNIFSIVLLFCFSQSLFGQGKNIIERKNTVDYSFELLNPMNISLEYFVFAPRHNIGYRYRLNAHKEIGFRYGVSSFNSFAYNYEILIPKDGGFVSKDILIDRGRTSSKMVEFNFRGYRKKYGNIAPFGMYYELTFGLQRYTLGQKVKYNSNGSGSIDTLEQGSIKTVALGAKFGRQWLFENNLTLNMGVSYKLVAPLSSNNLEVHDDAFINDVFQRDMISSFFSLGYVF